MVSQPRVRLCGNDWATAIVALLILAVLCASTVRLASASVFETKAILCDGVDDDVGPPVLCGLLEETTKDLSSAKERSQAVGPDRCSDSLPFTCRASGSASAHLATASVHSLQTAILAA